MATATKNMTQEEALERLRRAGIIGREPHPDDFTQLIGLVDDGYEQYVEATKASTDDLARVIFFADLICAEASSLVRLVNRLSNEEWGDDGPSSSKAASARLIAQYHAIERMVQEIGESKCKASLKRMDKAGQKVIGW